MTLSGGVIIDPSWSFSCVKYVGRMKVNYFVLLKIKVENWQIRTSSVLIAFHFSLLSSFSLTAPCGPSCWLPSPQSQTFTARTLYHIVSFNRHCVRWGSSSPTKRDTASPPPVRYCLITKLAPLLDEDEDFSAHFALARSPISAADELLFCYDFTRSIKLHLPSDLYHMARTLYPILSINTDGDVWSKWT